jgi:hypothetical protein
VGPEVVAKEQLVFVKSAPDEQDGCKENEKDDGRGHPSGRDHLPLPGVITENRRHPDCEKKCGAKAPSNVEDNSADRGSNRHFVVVPVSDVTLVVEPSASRW